MKDLIELPMEKNFHDIRDSSRSASVILLVGGSAAKLRLFEIHLKRLHYASVSVFHVVCPPAFRSESNVLCAWDPTFAILSLSERFRVLAIIRLKDSVVCQCDSVSARLGLRGNDPDTSLFRVDKQMM